MCNSRAYMSTYAHTHPPQDCPQRDERKGWLGDAQLSGEEAMANFDMVATLIKFLHDIVDTQVRRNECMWWRRPVTEPIHFHSRPTFRQNEEGQISDTAPYTFGGRPADPSWGSAFPSLVFFLYK